jgi:hypothetical protein
VSPHALDLPNISTSLEPNKLYFGDNLNILRTHIADASVDPAILTQPLTRKEITTRFTTMLAQRTERKRKHLLTPGYGTPSLSRD